MTTSLDLSELSKGLLLLAAGCGLGINGDHSSLAMLLLCCIALNGVRHILRGVIRAGTLTQSYE